VTCIVAPSPLVVAGCVAALGPGGRPMPCALAPSSLYAL
jgi:hypothetical protein